MDWNRDGKIDAHDATLYHTVINNDSRSKPDGSGSGVGRDYSNTSKMRSNPTPAVNNDSGSAGWIIAVVGIIVLFIFFS